MLKGSFALFFWPAHTFSCMKFTLTHTLTYPHTHIHIFHSPTNALTCSHTYSHTHSLSHTRTHTISLTYPDVPLHQISRVCVCVCVCVCVWERERPSLSHFRHCVVYRHPLSPLMQPPTLPLLYSQRISKIKFASS